MRQIPGKDIVWWYVPDCRDEAYKSKAAQPAVNQTFEELPVVSEDVLDEAEMVHIAQGLGEVASKETIA